MNDLDLDALRAEFPQRAFFHWDETDSTMLRAAAHPIPGAVFLADHQTVGRGRLGRSWTSPPGAGLYVTLPLQPSLSPDQTPLLTLALGIAAQQAVAEASGLDADIRWPNDLMIGPLKLAGILVQAQPPIFLAGIGINLLHQGLPAGIATSIERETGRATRRDLLLAELLRASDRWLALLQQSPPLVLESFERHSSYVRGKRVAIDLPAGPVTGLTAGLTPQGFLLLQTPTNLLTITAGGVRPLDAP